MRRSLGITGKLSALVADIRETIGNKGKYYYWGYRDDFPNILVETVNDSGTARLCVDRLQKFIRGKGFASPHLKNKKANREQTWSEFFKDMTKRLAYFPGIAVRVVYNQLGDPVGYYLVDIQHIRKKSNGNFLYGEGLGDPQGYHYGYNESKRVEMPPFGTCKTKYDKRRLQYSQEQRYGKPMGELLYVYEKGVGLNYDQYPVPVYASGLNDIKADAGLSVHEESQVSNSFKGGVIINTRKLSRDLDENDESEYTKVQDAIENFTGPDGSPVLLLEGLEQDIQTSIEALNVEHQMNATEKATDRVGRKVCRLFGVPPVLVGFATAGKLGDNQELLNNLKLFNLTLEDYDELIDSVFQRLIPNEHEQGLTKRNKLNIIDELPPELLSKLSKEELAKIYELPMVGADGDGEGVIEGENKASEPGVKSKLTRKQMQNYEGLKRDFLKDKITATEAKIFMQDYGFTDEQIDVLLSELKELKENEVS